MSALSANQSGLRVEQRGAGLWLTLSRPKHLNALTPAMVEAMVEALEYAEREPSVRVVIITGEGRAFCAGADIGGQEALADREAERLRLLRFLERVGSLTLAIEGCAKPVLAGLNGTTLAGGLELALACDLVVAAESAGIGDGHARHGLLPGGGSSVRLPRKLSPAKANWLLLSGELLSARDPLLADLFTKVVPDDRLVAEIERMVEILASRSPLVLRQMKTLASSARDPSVERDLRAERLTNSLHFYSHDRQEGLAAFRERREPKFKGC